MPSQLVMPGVILLGSDFKALGVARSLGRRGIPIVVIDDVPRAAWFSRYVIRRLRWHGSMYERPFVDFLLDSAVRYHLEQWILFPLQDDAVELLAQYSSTLASSYRLATQELKVTQWALDKRLTDNMAHQIGIPYPETWYPACENDIRTMDIRLPAIIKPARSIRLQHALRLKALPADTREALLSQYRRASQLINPDEIMVQEVIPGDGHAQFSVAAYSHKGQVLAAMTARRTRQYPIDYGLGSSFVEAFEVPELFQPTEQLLRFLGVSGMVEIEFKWDARDGQYKLLDINVRPWGWHTLCIACGLDFPYIHYCDMLGQLPPITIPDYHHRWIRVMTDVLAGWHEARAGITSPWRYLRSLVGPTVFSVFDLRDPLPAAGDIAVAFSRLVQTCSSARFRQASPRIDSDSAVKPASHLTLEDNVALIPEYQTDSLNIHESSP